MFFGLKINENQSDAGVTTFQNNVKLSQAVLEPNSKGVKNNQPVSIMVEHDNEHYCLCVLTPGQVWQCPLDLLMEADKEVKFYLKGGSGTVHLTGYEEPEFDMDDDVSDSDLADSDEEIESSDMSDIEIDEKNRVRALAKVPSKQGSKPTPTKAEASKDSSFKSTNGRAKLSKRQVAALNKLGEKIDDGDDETDSDDEDFDILNPDDEDDDSDANEDGEDDDDEDDDDDDEESDDDDDEEMSDEDMDDDSEDDY